nr:L,D-transpeptidase family protein [uncultured Flavobacterium sp.]
MRNLVLSIVIVLSGFFFASFDCNRTKKISTKSVSIGLSHNYTPSKKGQIKIDSIAISRFFKKYPDLKSYQSEVNSLYKKRKFHSIWFDEKGLIEFARMLNSKMNFLDEEGVKSNFKYKNKIDLLFNDNPSDDLSQSETEIMLSTMYLFYAKKVYNGIETQKTIEIEWLLPRKKISYESVLDSLLIDPKLLIKNEKQVFRQYYKLKEVLKKYRLIEQNKVWKPIEKDSLFREFKPFDSSKTIGQIRDRLFITGDLAQNSKSNLYDNELMAGILNYKKRNGYNPDYTITSSHIERMNLPIEHYIKTIMVNMERCRWIDPELTKSNEYIVINIPSFKLLYKKDKKTALEAKVFVGENRNETVIFSANMNQIIFSPYWNIPQSIIENELKFAIAKDKNYLESHNMEWNKGGIRQKPGPTNPLGLVKFVFPNSNDIYLHDTPSKSLFDLEYRAYSHGCINVNKAKELALLILKDNPQWPPERINEAMKGTKETVCVLKNKIPVHICYFTAWVNDSGVIHFYNDVYERDDRLAELLFSNSK